MIGRMLSTSRILIITLMMFASSEAVFSQPGRPPCPQPPCKPQVPITGIEWLLLSGGLLGGRRIYQKLKKGESA